MKTNRRVRMSRVALVGLCALVLGALPAVAGAAATVHANTVGGNTVRADAAAKQRSGPVSDASRPAVAQFVLPTWSPEYSAQQIAVGLNPATLATGPKLVIHTPTVLTTAYATVASRLPYPLPLTTRPPPIPSPPEFQSKIPGCVASHAVHIPIDDYVIQPIPGGQPLGVFPPTSVSMLAFGAIPVTATVHLSQVVDGKLNPMQIDFWQLGFAPCDPDLSAKLPYTWTRVVGQLSLTLSDVRVDNQPLDVGSECRTVSPLILNLWGAPDYMLGGGGTLIQRADTTTVDVPGGYQIHPDSTDLTIPAFTGCAGNGQDLSQMITSMVSGPGNQLAIAQGGQVVNPKPNSPSGFDINNPTACAPTEDDAGNPGPPLCPLKPPRYPVIPIPAN